MPHKCTRCEAVYEDGSENLLKGCECGNRYFMYFRKITAKEAEELKGEKNIREVGEDEKGVWNIKVKEGSYEIDVGSLMMQEPVIIVGDEGTYILSLPSAFKGKDIKKYVDRLKEKK